IAMPLFYLRLRREFTGRALAEERVRAERHYDDVQARALRLYNEEFNRERVLDGTLRLLAQDPLFPVSVFYAHEEWGGALRIVASHGAPASVRQVLHLDDGLVGSAARNAESIYVDTFDPSSGLTIETGLATLTPAGLLMAPVCHRNKLLGVLALAVTAPLTVRDREFVDRLAAQLAVALHNLSQLEEVQLLAEQLRARGRDIQQKNDELERANRMKSEFLANMSHELRTPLNAVIGFSEILKDGLVGDLPDEPRRYISEIHSSGKHLLSLINDILDLSKVEAGHMSVDAEPLDLVAVGRGALSVISEKAMARGIALSPRWEDDLGLVMLDARKAKQILYNLLSNAVKFTPDDGAVSLTVRRVSRAVLDETVALLDAQGRVFPPILEHATFVEIAVTDSGIGITDEGLAQLFQPFMQLDSSLSRNYEGTGLGLTMVKRLAELHGGGLGVRSRVGHGSTFFVWLPWIPAGPSSDGAATEAGKPAASTADAGHLGSAAPTIAVLATDLPAASHADVADAARDAIAGFAGQPLVLIVEDNPQAAELMKLQLNANGYRVAMTTNAEEALTLTRELRPQALILDVLLPNMDGWDLLAKLKEHPSTSHVPVVIVSITDQPRRGFALGAAQVLVKPVSQQDLLAAIAAIGIQQPGQGAPVLVVDDDPKAVDLVSMHLREGGFSPVAAYSGQEAIDLAQRHRPALIVLDLMMPGISGLDVLDTLGRRPETAGIAVVVLTAKLLTQADRQLLRGRVQAVVEKSEFSPEGLLAEVRRALARNVAATAYRRTPPG
ncbi:MAG: hypothetical protein JWP52_3652, partial [Rhizobacter sp.]|nr:hypothetical protein [Rhizobacter sp.]